MYGNEEALHYNGDKFIDAKNMILPYDDDPLVGSMMPNLCEIIDLDECGIPSSSASHEDDPIARFPCFPSGSYPFNSNVMNNQMEYNHAIMSSSLSSPSPLSYGHLVTTTILP
ncbi:hypothetical protein HHK36_025478 [Tetracentron sinense]|uniref:Uncharacterized protein n=1 Tax=Tetracentron sinense TaxID=13715 RepID=A0A835D362_TETSI|nr:hypothetical protein HHK36_025478 [Tetracentron sinense]